MRSLPQQLWRKRGGKPGSLSRPTEERAVRLYGQSWRGSEDPLASHGVLVVDIPFDDKEDTGVELLAVPGVGDDSVVA